MISGDNISRVSKVMLNYSSLKLQAETNRVNGMFFFLSLHKFRDLLTQRWKEIGVPVLETYFVNLDYFYHYLVDDSS